MDRNQTDNLPTLAACLECEEVLRAKMMLAVLVRQWSCATVTRVIRDCSAISVRQDILETQWSRLAAVILASATETSILLIRMHAMPGLENASNVCTTEEELTAVNALMDIMSSQMQMARTLHAFLADATSVDEILLSETR